MFNAVVGALLLFGLLALVVYVWSKRQPKLCARCGFTEHHADWVKCAPPPTDYATAIANQQIADGHEDPAVGDVRRVR